MARAIWKGHISFGLVNIPVQLFSAENKSDLSLRMLDDRNNARVRYERVNEETGEKVAWDHVIKAYEYEDGRYVVLPEDELQRVSPEATQTIDIEDFVEEKEIDTTFFEKPYYVVPGKKGQKGYVLLRETLKKKGRVGIARVVIRTKQYLAALKPQGDALVLELLRYHDELRSTDELELPSENLEEHKITKKEQAMAESLVDNMSELWEPGKYEDEYRQMLLDWIEQKMDKGETAALPSVEEPEGAEVIDMMEMLKRSVEKTGKEKKKASDGRKRKAK